jgi:hypothetical protein
MGLTEAFRPVSADGFTTAMPVISEDELDASNNGDFVNAEEEALQAQSAASVGVTNKAAADIGATNKAAADIGATNKAAASKGTSAKAGGSASRGKHAKHASSLNEEEAGKKKRIPEYMRKSRRMRRILLVVIVLLVIILGAMGYFGYQLYLQATSMASQQVLTTEHDTNAIQSEDASDSSTSVKTTTVPNLVEILGLTTEEAVEKLQHGAQASDPTEVNEEGNPIKSRVRVSLTAETGDSQSGTPTVYLGLNDKGKIIQAGYSTSTSSLGYGSLSFADAVRTEHIIEKTLTEAGLTVEDGTVTLPEDSSSYTTFASDGKTREKEYCSFEGTVDQDGQNLTWSAVLSYDYSMANASDNLADTTRTIYVYVNS